MCIHRGGQLAPAGASGLPHVSLSALSVLALATNTIVDRRCTDAQLSGEARDASVPSTKLSTRVTPGKSKCHLSGIEMPRPPEPRE